MKRNIIIFIVAIIAVFVFIFVFYIKFKTPKTLDEKAFYAATLGGNYLVRHFNEDGTFDYLYNPDNDEVKDEYNMLRHAGTVYALLELYENTGNKKYLEVSKKALDYINKTLKECPSTFKDFKCLYEGRSVKLGGNALSVLAFSKYAIVTGDKKYIDNAKSLADWILSTQSEDGEFLMHVQYSNGSIGKHISEYYPGESIYALMLLYKVTEDEKYLESAKNATSWIINVRDKNKTYKNINHDHWLLYGMKELYKYNQKDEYIEHAKKIVDGIVRLQHKENENIDASWIGGFYNPPRSTPTATRSEALVSAYDIFIMSGNKKYQNIAHETLRSAIVFELRTFIDGAKARKYKQPLKALGGFRSSLVGLSVRIDYVQHNISALLGFWNISKDVKNNVIL